MSHVRLVEKIRALESQGRFKDRVVGPLGAHVKLNPGYDTCALAAECAFRGTRGLSAFVVGNQLGCIQCAHRLRGCPSTSVACGSLSLPTPHGPEEPTRAQLARASRVSLHMGGASSAARCLCSRQH